MPTWTHRSATVIQAAGMVSVQADCTVDEALELMERRARDTNRTRRDIAEEVVARRIRFDPLTVWFALSVFAAMTVWLLGLLDLL
jgi:hypothetical protein